MYNGTLKNWLDSSYLIKSNQSYIERMYEDFLKNPHTIDRGWHEIFKQLSLEENNKNQSSIILDNDTHDLLEKNIISDKLFTKNEIYSNFIYSQILNLINSFRTYGHQYAILDPLELWTKKPQTNFLELEHYNFTLQDQKKIFNTALFGINKGPMTLSEIHGFLKKTYCGTIGIEYMHILDPNIVLWIQNNFESKEKISNLHHEEKKQFLKEAIAAEEIEHYLGTKFPGVKRFSLEGGDVLIPMLKEIIRYSVCQHNIQKIFFGMAHRGRLNVLVNVLGKNPQDLFDEFSNKQQLLYGSGDVKYHQGFDSDITVNGNIIHLSLLANPSHLEIINPVIMGSARAKIDRLLLEQSINHNNITTEQCNIVLPISIHGDAAISAQGIVQETFNMSKTRAYDVNGMIHIIINNQIGFTTSNIHDIRSTQYCTDIAKMIQVPIFHVNADDTEAVISVARSALNFRNKYKRDVIIDLICYRRHGHNEADEPSVTQPLMYKKIRNHPTLATIYSNILNQNKIINIDEKTNIINMYRRMLEKESCVLQKWQPIHVYSSLHLDKNSHENKSKIDYQYMNNKTLQELAYCISDIPSNITMHSRVKKIYNERIEMALGNRLFDWGGSEILAYATLLDQGINIRLSGEDVARGTFFHRHAIIYDQNYGTEYIPLMHIKKNQGSFFIWNSVLSESAALAFEYGYSSTTKNTLVIWEAQFGDFSNGAQIIIDQFISSSEQKWGKLCGLVMLLPHGFEGQGPEHSSARIERYLQLCAEYNMRVCVPSTPAQMYHVLCQQAICNTQKPLIIISPKSLLRHPMVTASLEELSYGSFKTVLHEIDNNIILNNINRVIICTGKIYYDLLSQRLKHQQRNIAIIRIEQLYPFPYSEIKILLSSYVHVEDFIWCQEEPKNQGAWYHIQHYFYSISPKIRLNYIGRPESAAPAVGYFSVHQQQQKKLINEALKLD